MSSTQPSQGLHILQFEESTKTKQKKMDILFTSDPRKSIEAASDELEDVLFKRFGYQGNLDNGDVFSLKHLFVLGASASQELEITLKQLVTYLRDLPHSVTSQKPDLFGLGTNRIRVEFEYIDLDEREEESW